MRPIALILSFATAVAILAGPGITWAQMTPPVVFMSDRDAVLSMTTGAKKYFVREVRVTPEEQRVMESHWGWRADEPFYRFFLGRDENGRLVSAVSFLTEFTIPGPMRVAVALGPDGKVKDARIVEVTEEITTWVRPLMSGGFVQKFIGLDSHGNFAIPASQAMSQENMVQFYGEVAARLIQRAAILFDVTVLKRGEK
jgi:hypothetical protein